jgi:hypothetical protein
MNPVTAGSVPETSFASGSKTPPFVPAFGLRAGFTQSLLATKRPARRIWRKRGIDLSGAPQLILDCGAGVRLTGYHNPQPPGSPGSRGLVVLIHGWEGGHESNYLYSMACALFRAGYSVFRLNLRDHSGSHHLNEELFHSARMAEVLGAFQAIRRIDATDPLYVIGFSLGGNFALRVGLQGPAAAIHPRLSIGISPAIHPGSTLKAIDDGPSIVHRYFIDKWMKTLDAKSKAWPGRYDFSPYHQLRKFVDITARFVADFTEYGSLDDYLAQYTLTPDMLMASPSPLALITSADDSVIPGEYFRGLQARGAVRAFHVTDRGGHCGFVENWGMDCWAEARVLELLR